jgi:hypothetical protein
LFAYIAPLPGAFASEVLLRRLGRRRERAGANLVMIDRSGGRIENLQQRLRAAIIVGHLID